MSQHGAPKGRKGRTRRPKGPRPKGRKPRHEKPRQRGLSEECAELLVTLEVARRLVELTGMEDVGEALEAAAAEPDFVEAGGGEVLDATVVLLADLWRLQSAVRRELTWPI